jgi:hypothetical protein
MAMKSNCFPPLIFLLLLQLYACKNPASMNSGNRIGGDSVMAVTDVADTTDSGRLNILSAEEKSAGWILLFDGKDLKGWHSYLKTSPGKAWTARNGSIVLDTGRRNGYQVAGGGDLVTEGEYDNFDFRLQWNIQACGNSGIIFYVHEDSAYHETWNTGPEMQVLDTVCDPDQKSLKHHAGDLYDLISCNPQTAKPAGQWNEVEIISDHGHLQLFQNGTKVMDTRLWDAHWKALIASSKFRDMPNFGTYKKGRFALQDHGAMVWYRNIMLKPL